MDDPNHDRAMEILADALEVPPEQRDDFVRNACAEDVACRDEVRRLLAADRSAPPLPTLPGREMLSRSLQAPDRVGPYKIVRELGQGGMGVVYLAQQERPVRRQVAIKLIHLGMNSAEVEARFDSERQALAMMNHPNVARVFDGGTTDTGRNYFVMEYVPGEPITEYCDRQGLGTRARLELFLPVCDAVQHSHQKGIVHRDLKPGNVMITTIDDQPVAKVIDFGIAKAIEQPLTERTFFTEHGRLMGTPEYMSPEQASMDGKEIDTRTDVYSLGVLLYELISGTLPFDRDLMRKSRFDEIRRLIRDVDPPRPSARLSQLGPAAIPVAHKRRSAPAALVRTLRGELDWVTMKAMEKDAARRYASAAELAADIRRYLDDEPVLAGPPSTVYRMGKFVRRHRIPVAAAGVVLLALVGGIVGVAWQAVAARRAEARATQRFNDVRAIANKLLFEFDQSIMYTAGTIKARRLLVTTAQEYLDKLARDAEDDVELQHDLASAYMGVASIQFSPNLPNLGDQRGAIATHRKAVEIARRIIAQRPDDSRFRLTLALALARYGALAYHFEPQPAIKACEEALAILEPLARQYPDRKAIRVDLGGVMCALAGAESDTGKVREGLERRRQAVQYFEGLLKEQPGDADVGRWLATCRADLGKSLALVGEFDQAEREMRLAKAVEVEFAGPDPHNAFTRRNVASIEGMLGEVYAQQKDFRRAAEQYASAVDGFAALVAIDSDNAQARADYGMHLHRLVDLQARSGDVAGAIRALEARFLPMVQKRYKPGHAMLLRYQIEYAALLRQAKRFDDAANVLRACEQDARDASPAMLPDVLRGQIELYQAWDKPHLAATAKAKLAQAPAVTTRPTH